MSPLAAVVADHDRFYVVFSDVPPASERRSLDEKEFVTEADARAWAAEEVSSSAQRSGSAWDFRGDLWHIPAGVRVEDDASLENVQALANVTWDHNAKAVVWADGVPDDWNPDDEDDEPADGRGDSSAPWGDDEAPF
ncbi:hypothetical protein SAMN05421776_11381 [Nocardia farcinica]|uniref:Uncharacterized protein n=1 Tax=Nocardia farcinica TaxID=37329 RepID=A0A0H5P9N8_NOCFR|nr:hypothetical protein [Nocardia farcinica]AXK90008.1 hypothetical protein DXT66_29920 [Nocardia farcinica]PFW99428.1 hypothetical protein CJ469_05348 [Nocardia farcinica]PFX06839.1 hypothetical protein CJ468_04239 [Nocardia farcinica]CRY84545.1 Uncharacterised protein [Nocardia farcinica]SIT32715.1 hypothetical protein SAMN05421776_11381 [Nocardia farcinica]